MSTVYSFQPRLIFLDHNMPQMTGTVATKMLKADPASRHIPIVCITSDHQTEILSRSAGADGFIRKPYDAGQLVAFAEKFTTE
jgi:two-component system cell cycle response regulator DivK